VVVLDNLATGKIENLAHIDSPNLEVIIGSVLDPILTDQALKGVSVVFHLAALADIVPSIENPLSYFENNVQGTVNVVDAARRQGVKKFIYAASSSCYGVASELPTTERASISPMYPYALTKWLGEEVVRHWGTVYGMPWISLRLFNVFGTRSRTSGTYGAVMGVFLAQKLAGKPLTVIGDGEQTRDFTYVSDVARAFLMAAECGVGGEVFNVGSGGTYSINYLAGIIGGDTVHISKRPGEPSSTFADTQKISGMLGWGPLVSFEAGMEKVLNRIQDWSDAPVWDTSSIEVATSNWFKYLGPKH
jgi:UDP-glucose 4-epimerase